MVKKEEKEEKKPSFLTKVLQFTVYGTTNPDKIQKQKDQNKKDWENLSKEFGEKIKEFFSSPKPKPKPKVVKVEPKVEPITQEQRNADKERFQQDRQALNAKIKEREKQKADKMQKQLNNSNADTAPVMPSEEQYKSYAENKEKRKAGAEFDKNISKAKTTDDIMEAAEKLSKASGNKSASGHRNPISSGGIPNFEKERQDDDKWTKKMRERLAKLANNKGNEGNSK